MELIILLGSSRRILLAESKEDLDEREEFDEMSAQYEM
jgi:hypothetical protein